MNKQQTFCVEIPVNDPEAMESFHKAMDEYQDEMIKYQESLGKELGIDGFYAGDIIYLRSRSRWNQELENRLIAYYKTNPKESCPMMDGEENEWLSERGF